MNKNNLENKEQPDAPAYVDRLLREASESGATDLYLLPEKKAMIIRSRSPQKEEEIAAVAPEFGQQCVARLKVLAGMLTYRTSTAQDGAIHNRPDLAGVAFRIATVPTRTGERMTIRILSLATEPKYLDELGFADSALQRLRNLLFKPSGLLVLTGPTGSGKTTTIYAMIRELLRAGENPATIFTIEDPVENEIPEISQVEVRSGQEDWSYAAALRAVLRHDVKTLVIGELRDAQVTRVALDAALTGHRIITTYHAGDIPSVYVRLLHQGFESFLVATAVNGVVSQRLLRQASGRGVVPVAAVLESTDAWRDFIIQTPGFSALRNQVAAVPGADLQAESAALAEQGVISAKEVMLL